VGELAGVGPLDVRVTDDLAAALERADVVIDFSQPHATRSNLAVCRAARKPLLVGTTGFPADLTSDFDAAAAEIPLLVAPNTSIGVTLLIELTRMAARALPADFDIEIVEAHHRMKKDAPSGTALALGKAAADGRILAEDARSSPEAQAGAGQPAATGGASADGQPVGLRGAMAPGRSADLGGSTAGDQPAGPSAAMTGGQPASLGGAIAPAQSTGGSSAAGQPAGPSAVTAGGRPAAVGGAGATGQPAGPSVAMAGDQPTRLGGSMTGGQPTGGAIAGGHVAGSDPTAHGQATGAGPLAAGGQSASPDGPGVGSPRTVARATGGVPTLFDRSGQRTAGGIGYAVIRGGDIVGEHTVLFAGTGEQVSLGHRATDRAVFARGALRAALWLAGRPPGRYFMRDFLGLKTEA
jgi:dihydrodipicolinate reductase